jgi:rSAM/selenodomain-associated transferase 1
MAKEHLIIFTRYPEPGKTKTRLIPALGAEGAAMLQRHMTEHTLNQVRELQSDRPITGEVRYAAGSLSLMASWLGSDIVYQPQGEGDLGTRMARSLSLAFQDSVDRAVIIGTDCPGLNAGLMAKAFHLLHSHDLVLGPAIDGGYYLLGLRYFIPELFTGINWGTATVLQQTVDIAKQLDLAVAYLPQLADVDRPEDLPVWEQIYPSTDTIAQSTLQ